MADRVDFTAHAHPVLAVRCPQCGSGPGAWCQRPSGHRGRFVGAHAARKQEADRVWEAQGDPLIIRLEGGGWAYAHGEREDAALPFQTDLFALEGR